MDSEKETSGEPAPLQLEMTPEGLGRLLFTNQQIYTILEDVPESIDKEMLKGQLITQAEVRLMVINQAKSGSSEAQKMVEQWRREIAISQVL